MHEQPFVVIHEAQPSDTDALVQLYRDLMAQQSTFDDGWTEAPHFDWQVYIGHILRSDTQTILAAKRLEEVVGFSHLRVRSGPTRGRSVLRSVVRRLRPSPGRPVAFSRSGYIEAIFVGRADRRQGIGRQLLKEAESWFASKAVPRVEATFYADNAGSRALFHEMGYEDLQTVVLREL